jgi:hypothetical protein
VSQWPGVWGRLFEGGPTGPTERRGLPGFRLCKIDGDKEGYLHLTGVTVGERYRWKPGLNRATCGAKHRIPGRSCGCGLYACTDLPALVRTLGPPSDPYVLCGVLGLGRFIEYERGWRAEYARIACISVEMPRLVITNPAGRVLRITRRSVDDRKSLVVLGTNYDVPLVSLDELMKFFVEQGD